MFIVVSVHLSWGHCVGYVIQRPNFKMLLVCLGLMPLSTIFQSYHKGQLSYGPRREKTCFRGLRPSKAQTACSAIETS